MALRLVTPPTKEVITLTEARDYLAIGSEQDDMVKRLIRVAISFTENYTKRRLAPQTWAQTYHYFPSYFRLELAPVRSISSITYYDTDNTLRTLATTDYRATEHGDPVTIVDPGNGAGWPTPHETRLNSVEVQYEVGYNVDTDPLEDPDALPDDLKQAAFFMLAHLYANREHVMVGAGIVASSVPFTFDALVTPYRRFMF